MLQDLAEQRLFCAGLALTGVTWAEAQSALAAGMAACLAALDPTRLSSAHDEAFSAAGANTRDSAQAAAAMLLPEADVAQAGNLQPNPVQQPRGAREASQAALLSSKTASLLEFLQGCKVLQSHPCCTLAWPNGAEHTVASDQPNSSLLLTSSTALPFACVLSQPAYAGQSEPFAVCDCPDWTLSINAMAHVAHGEMLSCGGHPATCCCF